MGRTDQDRSFQMPALWLSLECMVNVLQWPPNLNLTSRFKHGFVVICCAATAVAQPSTIPLIQNANLDWAIAQTRNHFFFKCHTMNGDVAHRDDWLPQTSLPSHAAVLRYVVCFVPPTLHAVFIKISSYLRVTQPLPHIDNHASILKLLLNSTQ